MRKVGGFQYSAGPGHVRVLLKPEGNPLYLFHMMTLLFLLVLLAMSALMGGKMRLSYSAFAAALILSIYWYSYHATSTLAVAL